jgi:hypothetical protein
MEVLFIRVAIGVGGDQVDLVSVEIGLLGRRLGWFEVGVGC